MTSMHYSFWSTVCKNSHGTFPAILYRLPCVQKVFHHKLYLQCFGYRYMVRHRHHLLMLRNINTSMYNYVMSNFV